jgi:HD-like signal output (HDOD) protein
VTYSQFENTTGGKLLTSGNEVPHDKEIALIARKAVARTNLRVGDLAALVIKDSPLALRVLRAANSLEIGGEKRNISALKDAIIRLGSRAFVSILDELESISYPELDSIAESLIHLKRRARLTALAAEIFAAETRHRALETSFLAGLFYNYGEMITLVNFREDYQKLAKGRGRAHLIFDIQYEFELDLEHVSAEWLSRCRIDKSIVSAISPESQIGGLHSPLRPFILAAVEIVDAFEDDRLSRFAPSTTPPPRSAVRMLGLSPARYERAFNLIFAAITNANAIPKQLTEAQNQILGAQPGQIPQSYPQSQTSIQGVQQASDVPSNHTADVNIQFPQLSAESSRHFESAILQSNTWAEFCQLISKALCGEKLFLRAGIISVHGDMAIVNFKSADDSFFELPLDLTKMPDLKNFFDPELRVNSPTDDIRCESPFGSRSFMVSNCTDTPYQHIFIYADRGNADSLPREAQDTFQQILSALCCRLRSIPSLNDIPAHR